MPKHFFALGVEKSPKTVWREKIQMTAIFHLIPNLNIVQYTYPQDPDTQTLRLQGVLHSTEGAPNFCYKVNAEQYFTDVTLALMEN